MSGDHEWIDDATALDQLVKRLDATDRYALDTEFHRERTYWPQLALVQIAWEGGLALIDPLAVDISRLSAVFDDAHTAVLHAADQDLEILHQACASIPPQLFDTQIAAGFLGWSTPSLSTLVHEVLGERLAKGDRLTDWMARPLSAGQRAYAAADVAHLLALHDHISERLSDCGRLAWAEEECRVQLGTARAPQDPETAWWRLKDNRSLRGSARGIAQEVAAWRERRAAALDRPVRFVLPDLAIVGIANRPPKDERALRDIRGLDGRHLGGGAAAEILAAVERGRSLPSEAIRAQETDVLDRRLRPAVALVSAWISQLAGDLQLDPAILATRADLAAFLQGRPHARLGSGWRHDLVGEPVRRLVEGEAALAFRPGTGDLQLEARSGVPILVDLAVPAKRVTPSDGDPPAG